MQWYEILALYLIFGVPGTIAYTLLEYQMYFKDRITYWKVLKKDFRLRDASIIYLGWLYFLIVTIFTFIAWKINDR
jgi:hypothetical protein